MRPLTLTTPPMLTHPFLSHLHRNSLHRLSWFIHNLPINPWFPLPPRREQLPQPKPREGMSLRINNDLIQRQEIIR
jgi:hypothetical protein